jgi:hypothetical protein
MADAEKDIIGPAEDEVSIADGGGPFQTFSDVPGRGRKTDSDATTAPDHASTRKRSFRGVVKDNLAGR